MLRRSDDGPKAPQHIIKQLKSIDRNLELRFYIWAPSHQGNPLLVKKNDGLSDELEPVYMPRWYLYLLEDSGRAHLLRVLHGDDGSFRPLDQRVVKETLSDTMRVLGLKEILRRMKDDVLDQPKKARKAAAERNMMWEEANQHKLNEARGNPFGRAKTHRDEKIMSYGGQTVRSSGRGTVALSKKEKGFVNPEE